MTATLSKDGKQLTIVIDANVVDPGLSSTGATFAVASTSGAVKTALVVKGQPLQINLNCYVKNPDYVKPAK
jgi:hypothetical protein